MSIHYPVLPVAQLLCDHGADVNVWDEDGITPLWRILLKGQQESSILPVVQLLCDHGADGSMRDKCESDAVDLAESRGWMEVVKVLRRGKFFFSKPRNMNHFPIRPHHENILQSKM